LDPVAEAQAKKTSETIAKSNEILDGNIEDQITTLSKSISQVLSKINEDIVTQTNNLKTIKEAIAIKEAELKELFGIEKHANTLAALVNAHQELKLEQEKELVEGKEKASAELNEILEKIKAAREEYQTLMKEEQEKLTLYRQRTEEEFKYDFERHKKRVYDQLEDELAAKRKAFRAEVEKKEEELSDYSKTLNEREKAIAKREEKMDELEAEVASLPEKIANIKAEANKKAEAKIKKTLEIREATMRKEIEADKKILEAERDYFKSQLEDANAAMATLQAKLDEAYKRIQEMGIQMVSSSNEAKAFDKIAALVTEKSSK
jgi:chromosome segregation ATPase